MPSATLRLHDHLSGPRIAGRLKRRAIRGIRLPVPNIHSRLATERVCQPRRGGVPMPCGIQGRFMLIVSVALSLTRLYWRPRRSPLANFMPYVARTFLIHRRSEERDHVKELFLLLLVSAISCGLSNDCRARGGLENELLFAGTIFQFSQHFLNIRRSIFRC